MRIMSYTRYLGRGEKVRGKCGSTSVDGVLEGISDPVGSVGSADDPVEEPLVCGMHLVGLEDNLCCAHSQPFAAATAAAIRCAARHVLITSAHCYLLCKATLQLQCNRQHRCNTQPVTHMPQQLQTLYMKP